MARIIPTCNKPRLIGFIVLALASMPAYGAVEKTSLVESYVDARLSEFSSDDSKALVAYLKLFKLQGDSEILADRILDAAIRTGDRDAAVRAVRAQELRGTISDEAPLILFADAFAKKNWAMARIAAAELDVKSNFAFMTPILTAWVDIAEKKPTELPAADPDADPLFAYYSLDQRIYMQLAKRQYRGASDALSEVSSSVDEDFVRDLLIRSAPILANHGFRSEAGGLIDRAVENTYAPILLKPNKKGDQTVFSPNAGAAILQLRTARTFLAQDRPEKALIFARLAQWLDPDSVSIRLTVAQILFEQGDAAEASALLSQVPVNSPYWPRSVADNVQLLLLSGQDEAALGIATDAVNLRPNSVALALVQAQAFDRSGDPKRAAQSYRRLVSDADTQRASARQRSQYRLLLATALDQMGDWQQARTLLDEARDIDPTNALVLNYLGYSLLEHHQEISLGLEFVRKAYVLSPESVAITDSLGWGYFLAGQYDKAVPLLEKAAKESGNNLTVNEHLGDAYWLSGRFIDARYAWRMAAQTASDGDVDRLSSKIDLGLESTQPKP